VLVECLPDRAEVFARYGLSQIDAGHLADEERVQALDGESRRERIHGFSEVSSENG